MADRRSDIGGGKISASVTSLNLNILICLFSMLAAAVAASVLLLALEVLTAMTSATTTDAEWVEARRESFLSEVKRRLEEEVSILEEADRPAGEGRSALMQRMEDMMETLKARKTEEEEVENPSSS